jgi:hypothetical protein
MGTHHDASRTDEGPPAPASAVQSRPWPHSFQSLREIPEKSLTRHRERAAKTEGEIRASGKL